MSLNPRIADWNGRVVWLVGASTGIGRATAALLHQRGAQVIVSARTASALDGFVRAHPGSEALALDVTERASLAEAAAEVVARHGRIDLVVYSAGVFKPMRATAFDLDEALRQLQINYVGALNLLGAVLPAAAAAGRRRPQRPPEPGVQRHRLPRAAHRAGLWPDEGGADQPGRDAVPGPATPRASACRWSTPATWTRRPRRRTTTRCRR